MTEKTSQKKGVGRIVVVALGIACIVLLVVLFGAIAYYTSIINGKNSTIATKDFQISSLSSQVSELNSIVSLTKFEVWVKDQTISQSAHSYTHWTQLSASYAGYVSVNVQSSTTTNTYVRVIYSSHGVYYDEQIVVGVSGTAVFPILPCSNIDIRVGNTNLVNGATETVTITYYY